MIFHYSTPWDELNPKTPEIVIALRGDSELYHEALRAFCKQNWYRIKLENFWPTELMSKTAVENIHKLYIL